MQPVELRGTSRLVAATTTSQQVSDLSRQGSQLEINNAGPGDVAVVYGPTLPGLTAVFPTGTTHATGGNYIVLAGQCKVITKGEAEAVAVVSNSTATVYLHAVSGY